MPVDKEPMLFVDSINAVYPLGVMVLAFRSGLDIRTAYPFPCARLLADTLVAADFPAICELMLFIASKVANVVQR
jgi:hypothetical protein